MEKETFLIVDDEIGMCGLTFKKAGERRKAHPR
jgi:hypothetical protein